jgi:AraC-like DNA-binding protein
MHAKTETTVLLTKLHERGWPIKAIASEIGYSEPSQIYHYRTNGRDLPRHRLVRLRALAKSKRRYPPPRPLIPIDDPVLPRRRRLTPAERRRAVRDVLFALASRLVGLTNPNEIVAALATVDAVVDEVIAAYRRDMCAIGERPGSEAG